MQDAGGENLTTEKSRVDVALVTCAEFPQLPPDDQPVVEELRRRGLRVEAVVWDEAGCDWNRVRLACLRASWDYSTKCRNFLRWIETVSPVTTLWNPRAVLEWNSHKSYLQDLAEAGIEVADMVLLPKRSRADLAGLVSEHGWADAVVKPAVSGTARETIRLSQHPAQDAQRHLDRLLESEDALVQEFVASVESEGELSLIFLDGQYSHAVRKRAKAGDFRVLEEWGGNTIPEEPSRDALDFAVKAMAQSPAATLYGRVDILRGNDGRLQVSELELVEPELYFRHAPPEAPVRFADAIMARL